MLLKGLEGPSKTISQLDSQAAFRIAQSRSELAVDTTLTPPVLLQFSQVLLAEAETLQLVASANTTLSSQSAGPKTKALQTNGVGTTSKQTAGTPGLVCRFWGTTEGCKNGKGCKYNHPELPDKKDRCWNCSASTHRKNECPHLQAASGKSDGGSGGGGGSTSTASGGKSGGKKGGGEKPNVKSTKAAGGNGSAQPNNGGAVQENQTTGKETVTNTPPEKQGGGNEMMSGGTVGPAPSTGETELVSEVTSLLRSLRAEAAVKVCGLKKVQPGAHRSVLLDGGATHCLRTSYDNQEWKRAHEIEVSLAEGTKTMKQCPFTKTLLTKEEVQSIIPVSLVASLGYNIQWNESGCRISHQGRPDLPVQLVQGCPTLDFDVGMKLFREVEENQREQCWIRAVLAGDERSTQDDRFQQLRDLFTGVPLRLLERIPGKKNWDPASIPINRRRRRQIQQAKTLVFNVFSGPDDGPWKKLETNGVVVVCLDVLLKCNLLDSNVAGWIEEVIQTRGVDLWLAGPPCRTISLLRHQSPGPVPLRGGLPEHRFGLPGLSPSQQTQADDDSVLWLRNLWWMWLNKVNHPTARNFLEQPRDPSEWFLKPGEDQHKYPSFLRWEETKKVASSIGLEKIQVEQGALGHQTIKPSTFLTDLEEVKSLDGLVVNDREQAKNLWPSELDARLQFSKSLAAWAPGLKSLLFQVVNRIAARAEPAVKRLSS